MGTGVSSSHFVSAVPSSSHSSPAPAWDPTQGRQFSTNFTSVSPFHRVQYFINCSSVSPAGSQVLPANLLQCGFLSLSLSLSTGSQVLPGTCSSTGFPWGHRLIWASTCSGMVSSVGCRWISAPLWTSMGWQGDSLPYHGLLHRLHGNFCSSTWSTSSPSFCTDLGVCRVDSHTVSLLSPAANALVHLEEVYFFPLLNHGITEVLPCH